MKIGSDIPRTWWASVLSVCVCGPLFAQDARFDPRDPLATAATLRAIDLGDLDGDGDPDTVAADESGGRMLWLESDGDVDPVFSIEHVISSGLVSPRAVALGDLDGDGDLDVAAAGSSITGRVVWFENQGGLPPVFIERQLALRPNLESTGVVRSIELADVEGDGDLDVICGFQLPSSAPSGHVTLYLNDGASFPTFTRFQLPSPTAALFEVTGVASADINADGSLDLVAVSRHPTAGDDADSVVAWLNTGAQTPGFVPAVIADALGDPAALALAPLDADALPEIAVAQQSIDRVTIFANSAGSPGTFQVSQSILAPGVGDVDAAPLAAGVRTDLLAATDVGPFLIENLGGPGPMFAAAPIASSQTPIAAVALGPIDNDADTDIAAAGAAGARWFERVQPVLNQTSGDAFSSIGDAVLSVNPAEVLLAAPEHFVPDLVVPASTSSYRLESTAGVHIGPRAKVEASSVVTIASAAGDQVLVDGTLALAPASVLRLSGTDPVVVRSGQNLTDAEASAIDSPLLLDLRPEYAAEDIDGAFSAAPSGLAQMPRDAQAFFPSADGAPAVAAVSESVGGGMTGAPGTLVVHVESGVSPSGWSAAEVDAAEAGTHRSLATGDLNRDGFDDLASVFVPANGNPAELRVHLSDGDSPPSFTSLIVAPSQSEGGHTLFDLDRDGLADVVTPTGYYRQVPGAGFSFVPFPVVGGDRGLGAAVARLNADFEPDVVVHTATLSGPFQRATGFRLVALIADGLGGFTPSVVDSLDRSTDPACVGDCYPALNTAPANLNTLTAADMDHDGDDDIVLSDDLGLSIYENNPLGFTRQQLPAELTWSESVAVDATGDGLLDLVVAATPESALIVVESPLIGSGEVIELVRPVERICAIDSADLDGDDLPDLVFAATAFDRIAALRRQPESRLRLLGSSAALGSVGQTDLRRGTLELGGGFVDAGGQLLIREGGKLVGQGQVFGSVFNGGLIAPRPSIFVGGSYAQFDGDEPTSRGTLDVLLTTAPIDPLAIAGPAALAGALRVDAEPGVVLGPTPRRLVRAQSFQPGLDEFESTLVPRVDVDLIGQPEPGVGVVLYDQMPAESLVLLGPRPIEDPALSASPFPALATPADAVIGDLVGGPNGGPDGIPDIVIAYPALPGTKSGGVALLAGEQTENGCRFLDVGVYTGQNADAPTAVEIGDFDGDGQPEIAFGNRGDSQLSNLVHFLNANSASPNPLTDSAIVALPLAGDRRITDLAILAPVSGPARRGPSSPAMLLTLTSGGVTGIATAGTYETNTASWEVCDIDVCDDPDSFDPIDVDGAGAILGEGFASSSTGDDKVVVARNTGGMPNTFPLDTLAAGSNPTEIRAEDLNNDGFPDIATINETSGTVSVFVNIPDAGPPGGRAFAPGVEWTLRSDAADPDPLPSSIALADLDDDGDLDIAVVSTDALGDRAVRSLTNLFVETGSLAFALPENLPTQPADTPLLVREFDAGVTGGVALNDDLVVLTDPSGGSLRVPNGARGLPVHALYCSEFTVCLPDVNGDGLLNPADFNAWILAFNTMAPEADQNGDGIITPADFNAWVLNYNAGC